MSVWWSNDNIFLFLSAVSCAVDRMESLPGSLVQEWYEMRAGEIEARSRLVEHALELVKLAIERGFDVSLQAVLLPWHCRFLSG